MSTLTQAVMAKQKKIDWFSKLSTEDRNKLIKKYFPEKSIENDTLLNEDVFFIYDYEERIKQESFEILSYVDLRFMYTKHKPSPNVIKKIALITCDKLINEFDKFQTLEQSNLAEESRRFWIRVKERILGT